MTLKGKINSLEEQLKDQVHLIKGTTRGISETPYFEGELDGLGTALRLLKDIFGEEDMTIEETVKEMFTSRDAELQAIATVFYTLNPLTQEERTRILVWLIAKFQIYIPKN